MADRSGRRSSAGILFQLNASRLMDNQRLILFIVFSFSLLLLWEAWQDKHAPAPIAPATVSAPTPSQALNAPAADRKSVV